MSAKTETAQGASTQSKQLIQGIDIHNADAAHEANAAALRKLPFQRNIFNLLARSSGLFISLLAAMNTLAGTIDADYEFYVNEPLARKFGLGDEKIEALKKSLNAEELFEVCEWSEREKCLVTMVDETVKMYGNMEETIQRAKTVMTEDEIVEVYIVLGLYDMIARITKGMRIDKELPADNMADLNEFIHGFVLGDKAEQEKSKGMK